jgi:hypothetical protein
MPDLLLADLDSALFRQRLSHEPLAGLLRNLIAETRQVAENDLATDEIRAAGWCHSLYFTPHVLEAAVIWRLTGEAWALAHVERQLGKMHRVYADYPASFKTEIKGFGGKPSAYFSVANTALAADLCRAGLGAGFERFLDLVRTTLLRDRTDAPYFFTHFNAAHNAVVTHVIATGIAALALGREAGHPEAAALIEHARDACEMHLRLGFDACGVPFEGPMYALVTLDWVYLFSELLRRAGGENLFVTLRPRFEAVADALAALQLPGFIGYSGAQDCRSLIQLHPMPWLLLSARELGRPQDRALWSVAMSGDHRGAVPGKPADTLLGNRRGLMDLLWWDGQPADTAALRLPPAYVSKGAAVAQFRTSAGPDAVWAMVLGQGRSHNVPDHAHADAGHVSIFAHGDYLAYDTGYFNFDEDTHSVVLIDGKPHAPATQGNHHHGSLVDHGSHPMLDWARIDAASAKGCLWADRLVLFIRGEGDFAYLAVLDNINRDNGVHAFQWQLQGNLHTRIDMQGDSSADVVGNKARLECHFFNPRKEDYPTCPHSLRVFADAHPHLHIWKKEPETNPRLVAEQTGPNCNLMALVIPRHLADPRLVVRSAPGLRTFNAYVEHGEWIDQIVYAPDHLYIRLPDLRVAAEAAVVRRDRSGAIVSVWTLGA